MRAGGGSPVVGAVIGFLIFSEVPKWDNILGIGMILAAIAVLGTASKKRKQSVNNP